MAVPDTHKNFDVSTVATAPSPAISGLSLVVAAGHGSRFPATPFNATVKPDGFLAEPTNAEIIRVTNIAVDTLTIARAQEGSSARTILVGDRIFGGITDKTLTDAESVGNEVLLQRYVAPGGVSIDVDLSAITPAITGKYKHLKLRGLVRGERINTVDTLLMRLNNDSTSGRYAWQGTIGNAASASGSEGITAQTSAQVARITAANFGSMWCPIEITLFDFEAAKWTPWLAESFDMINTTSGSMTRSSWGGVYQQAVAVTRFALFGGNVAALESGSFIDVIGIR